MFKLLYLLPGVASADLAVGHGAVFGGGGQVVEGFLRQRQSGAARAGDPVGPRGAFNPLALLRLHLKRPVTGQPESSVGSEQDFEVWGRFFLLSW